jgi:hypothetical protein
MDREIRSAEERAQVTAEAAGADAVMQRCFAFEEAAHVIMLAYLGDRAIRYAQIGKHPRTVCQKGAAELMQRSGPEFNTLAVVLEAAAGAIGVGIAARRIVGPTAPEMFFFLEKAKAGTCGPCDRCKIASMLVLCRETEGAGDAERLRIWVRGYKIAIDLFDTREARTQLFGVARALIRHAHLDADGLARLIDGDALRSASPLSNFEWCQDHWQAAPAELREERAHAAKA